MQTLTLKVGDPMTEQIKHTADVKNQRGNSPHTHNTASEAINIFRSIARTFCHLILKMKLKEMGNGVKCDGKLNLTGTKNIKIGDGCHFYTNVKLLTEGRGYIHIGQNVKVGRNVKIISRNNVTIEDNTIIGADVTITDIITKESDISAYNGTKSVYIGKDVWIGKNTEVQAGVTVGNGATISSNSVISRSIPPKVIAGGAPARVIKEQ